MSLQDSFKSLTSDLDKLNARVKSIGSNPSTAEVKELNQIVSLLSGRLQSLNTEQANVLMERRAGEAAAKQAAISAHGNDIMRTINGITTTLREKNQRLRAEQEQLVNSVDQQRQILSSNQANFRNYSKTLQNKMELLATRDRMLQLSQERNVYKKKVIYVLFAVIIALLVAIIAAYSFFNKKK